jgi:hypothetical protein
MAFQSARLTSATGLLVAPAGGSAILHTVNVNTGATSARLDIYDGVSTAGNLKASIDATSKSSHYFGFVCPNGIYANQVGGTADISIGYS